MNIVKIQPNTPGLHQEAADQARKAFESGGLVVFPTETVYGIGASAASPAGVRALQVFKQRQHPFTVHLPSPAAAEPLADLSHPLVQRLVRKAFPGPVTLLVDVAPSEAEARVKAMGLPADAVAWLYHDGSVGLRCPDMRIAQDVLGSIDAPVIASSANPKGHPPPYEGDQAIEAVGQTPALAIDAGRCRFAMPSTIVRVRNTDAGPEITVERDGVYSERVIQRLLQCTVLFVCSGNTCRSPMAAGIARKILAQQHGVSPDRLEEAGFSVRSAGVFASAGAPATAEAVDQMHTMGIDITRHRSQPLTPQLIHEADVLYCMTHAHQDAVAYMAPWATDKALPLAPNGEVEDPIGSGPDGYERCAKLIHRLLEARLKELPI